MTNSVGIVRVKLNALTGLRFVAAGMIVAYHSRSLKIPVPHYPLDHGVSFFFVLSGFVIAYAYPTLGSKREIFNFLVARVARIWPAHFVALLLVLAAFQPPIDWTIVPNLLLLQGWVPSFPWYFSYNAVSWSISTELFFYLIFPVLISQWATSWWWKWLASATLVLALIWLGEALRLPDLSTKDEPSLHGLLYINPLARLFEFTTGMVTCLAFQYLNSTFDKRNSSFMEVVFTFLEILVIAFVGYCFVTSAAIVFLAPYFQGAGVQWLEHAGNVLIFPPVLLVFAFGRGWLSRFFGSPPMILLGEISFSIYLVHTIVFSFYQKHWQLDQATPNYIGLAACVIATLALAFIIWIAIEVPCRTAAKQVLKTLPQGDLVHLFVPVVIRFSAGVLAWAKACVRGWATPKKVPLSVKVSGAILGLIVSTIGALYLLDGPKPFLSIDGDWCVDRAERTRGGPARIALSETKIIFYNEGNAASNGHFEGHATVVADDWGGLRGSLNANKTLLAWTNNTNWRRKPEMLLLPAWFYADRICAPKP
jgi:peptidoglycan/LPS O-acetylase OafA/YrhL